MQQPVSYEGIVREARRPAGWEPPGPVPPGPEGADDLWPAAGEDLCYLTGHWRGFHRYSLDDLATAWFAVTHSDGLPITRHADIGCGIGSVLMMVSWALPQLTSVGVEAQDLSVGLARRSVRYNGATDRITVRHGDLRDPELVPEHGTFDLVTGTPPYIPVGDGVISDKEQCGPCRFELRGGIEDYCLTAARLLAPGGRFYVCQGAAQTRRVELAAEAAGLTILRRRDVVPREGRAALFSLYQMARAEDVPPAPDAVPHAVDPPFIVRDAAGEHTDAYFEIRARMGMPPRRVG